ncbi:major royal jelly family protein [Sphingobacterium hotanense]|uniref:major royal jelly family protein n=1 Tax=Sphingobacterium hotanense TaxID=649196 RepID=UPI0021A3FB33|nr:major royal jelly family protein [Sphingobacterium hotanense]MCT1526103.1 major royal jelly family protein [Sphingobacterium hotanense]
MRKVLSGFIICLFSMNLGNAQVTAGQGKLEVVASLDKAQPIGVSVSSTNRVFVSFPHREPYLFGLTEIVEGNMKPYPNHKWQLTMGNEQEHYVNVQDIYVDTADQLWVLDSKPAPKSSIFGGGAATEEQEGKFKLIQFDLKSNQLVRIYNFEDLNKGKAALNDVRVDTEKGLAYLSDPGQAGIVVLDLETGTTRTVLGNSKFTLSDRNIVLSYEGREMRDKDGNPFSSNVNGIALSKDNKWFYFKPINGLNLYRIETKHLADESLRDIDLVNKIENVAEVGVTHGLVADKEGNIYLTNSLDYSIRRVTPEGKIELIVQDPRLLWPDSLGVGSDGYLYFSCAQMHLLPQWNGGEDKIKYPFEVYRVKVL